MREVKILKVEKVEHPYPVNFYGIYNSANKNYITNGFISHNCGMMDEMDFYSADANKKNIFNLYNQLRSRIESRFIKRGLIRHSKLILLSSKRSTSDFLESYIRKVRKDPRRRDQLYLVDKPIWEVKTMDYPPNAPSFKVAVGNRALPSLIIEREEDEEHYRDQGYKIIKVPESLRLSFESDINLALQDKAGIALDNNLKYLSDSKIEESFSSEESPIVGNIEIYESSLEEERRFIDLFDIEILKRKVGGLRLYIHFDLAYASDILGICGSIINLRVEEQEIGDKKMKVRTVDPAPIFYIGIKAKKGSEINLNKAPELIRDLERLGFSIGRVSADSFQSKAILQDLRDYNSLTLSVDRPITPYKYFKTLVNSKRLKLYPHSLLEKEMRDVVYDSVKDKVDHTDEGSKDILDAVVGSCYNAITSEEAKELSASTEMDIEFLSNLENRLKEDKLRELSNEMLNNEEGFIQGDKDNIFSIFDDDKYKYDW